jgi:hypothetical protein
MDIIAAHQQGLIEQLEEEVAALAGRPRDHGQRAVVLHHLYDHSRGSHAWALAEGRRELRIFRGIASLERRLDRWGWFASSREEARAALACLAAALGELSRRRCAAAYLAYRLSATPALRGEAELRLPAELLEALDQCHSGRRLREPVAAEVAAALATQSEDHAPADSEMLRVAWSAIDASGLKRAAHRLLGSKALERAEAKDRKCGWDKAERELRNDPLLPSAFRANPAQHFYALQLSLAERRRQQWREACDREPDAFELAA